MAAEIIAGETIVNEVDALTFALDRVFQVAAIQEMGSRATLVFDEDAENLQQMMKASLSIIEQQVIPLLKRAGAPA